MFFLFKDDTPKGSRPVRATETEAVLVGRKLDDETLKAALKVLRAEVLPAQGKQPRYVHAASLIWRHS